MAKMTEYVNTGYSDKDTKAHWFPFYANITACGLRGNQYGSDGNHYKTITCSECLMKLGNSGIIEVEIKEEV